MTKANKLESLYNARDSIGNNACKELVLSNTSSRYFYKYLQVLKQNLQSSRKVTDDIIFSLRDIIKLINTLDTTDPNIAKYLNRYKDTLDQELECKRYLDNLALKTTTNILDFNCDMFMEMMREYNPDDIIMQKTSMPWNVYATITWFMQLKWNKFKRVFCIDSDWLEYLIESFDKDISLAVFESMPYTNFGMILKYDDVEQLFIIVDYDASTKVLSVSGQVLSQLDANRVEGSEEGLYVMQYYSRLDVSGTYLDALNTCMVYSMDDIDTFSDLVGPRRSSWRTLDMANSTLIASQLIDDDVPVKFIDTSKYGRYPEESVEEPRVITVEPDDIANRTISSAVNKFVLAMLLYMCAENSAKSIVERQPNSNNTVTTKTNKKKITNPIVTYDVAVKEVAMLRSANSFINNSDRITVYHSGTTDTRTVRPHVRRAHWHHYWVGKHDTPERKLVLRLVMPTLVGGTEACDIANTTVNSNTVGDMTNLFE